MDVLFVTRTAAFVGGAERHVADVAGLLAARGHRPFLLHDPNAPIDPAFARAFAGAFPLVEPERQVALLRPDALYVHQVDRIDLLARLAATGVPAVRFFHDHAPFCPRSHKYTTLGHVPCTRTVGPACWPCLGPVVRADGFPPVRLRTPGRVMADLAVHRRLAAFAVGSVYMKDHVVAHGFAPAAVRALPMFLAPPDPRPPGARDPARLLFAGALVRGKGLDVLLRALARLPGVRLDVVGAGRQEGLFRSLADRLGVASRVDFLGGLDRPVLDARLRAAACLVVPSREPETFGLVGLEAFRHATPVVASRVGGIGEWLVEGVTGFGVPPCDDAALAAAVGRVLDDPAGAAARGAAGRDLLETRFTAARHVEALLDLLAAAGARGRDA